MTHRKRKLLAAYLDDEHIGTGTFPELEEITTLKRSTLSNIIRLGHKRYRIEHIGYSVPVYALYDGDDYIADGTLEELAEKTGHSIEKLSFRRWDSWKKKRLKLTMELIDTEHILFEEDEQ